MHNKILIFINIENRVNKFVNRNMKLMNAMPICMQLILDADHDFFALIL